MFIRQLINNKFVNVLDNFMLLDKFTYNSIILDDNSYKAFVKFYLKKYKYKLNRKSFYSLSIHVNAVMFKYVVKNSTYSK